jgi:hypothetical protein
MPREANLFRITGGSPSRALKRVANIPPSWIARARKARKAREPQVAKALQKASRLRRRRPNARDAIRNAEMELRALLREWEVAYQKQCFYYGIRALLEIGRKGKTSL